MDKWLESKIPQHMRATSEKGNQCPECSEYIESMEFGQTCTSCRTNQSKVRSQSTPTKSKHPIRNGFLCLFAFWIFAVGLRLVTHEIQSNVRAAERTTAMQQDSKSFIEQKFQVILETYRTNPDHVRKIFMNFTEAQRMQVLKDIVECVPAHPGEPLSGESLELYKFLTAANSEVQLDTVELTAK